MSEIEQQDIYELRKLRETLSVTPGPYHNAIRSLDKAIAVFEQQRTTLNEIPPEGWQLVPVDLPDPMFHAIRNSLLRNGNPYLMWKNALAAAPTSENEDE